MALSYIKYSGDGATTNFAVPFAYIDRTHVKVLVGAVDTAFTWVNSSTIQISPAPAVGVFNINIYRTTPSLIPIVDFYDTDQDLQSQQILYIQQENMDTMADVLATAEDFDTALAAADADAAAAAASAAAASASATAAQTARVAAELAETNAETAETNAETAQAAAEAAKIAAEAAEAAAVVAKNAAELAETNAETAETNAETAQAAAAASAAAALASEAAALASKNAAETAETNAETAETNAAASAAAAAASALTANLSENPIINPCMDIWQRGTSFVALADGTYTADRWVYVKSGAMVHTVQSSTDVPSVGAAGLAFNFSLLADCTTVDAAIAAGDYCLIGQKIEGFNWRHFAQRALTLSFWVKATKTGTYCVVFKNGTDRSFVREYTVSVANTWEKKTLTVLASPSAGTWDYGNGAGLYIWFVLAGGSTFHTTAGAWQTGNFFCTANQVNACDNVANDFRLTGVKLELGSTATDLRFRSYSQELELCQRYYETGGYHIFSGNVTSGFNYYTPVVMKVIKRAVPTIAFTDQGNSSFAAGVPSTLLVNDHMFAADKAANATGSGGFYAFNWFATAEL
jgi:hypothetical protein